MTGAGSAEERSPWLDMAQTAGTADLLEARQIAHAQLARSLQEIASRLKLDEVFLTRAEEASILAPLTSLILRNLKVYSADVTPEREERTDVAVPFEKMSLSFREEQ